jgi:hypothetical protein
MSYDIADMLPPMLLPPLPLRDFRRFSLYADMLADIAAIAYAMFFFSRAASASRR